MNATPELVALVQREREARIREDHLLRIAARAHACCGPNLIDLFARALRGISTPS
jgi:hypothetical protein